MKSCLFLVVAFLVVLAISYPVQGQGCSSQRTYNPEVCLFSGTLSGVSGGAQSDLCESVNPNPIDVLPTTGYPGVSAETCSNAVWADGNSCTLPFHSSVRPSIENRFAHGQICRGRITQCGHRAPYGRYGIPCIPSLP